MFIKNYLTKILKKLTLHLDEKCSELRSFTGLFVHNVAICCAINSRAPQKGVFCVPKNNQKYAKLSTTKQKTSSEKLGKSELKTTQKKIYNRSLSEFFTLVKGKFVDTFFKPITRDFTLQDLELVQKLLDKNKLDYPKAWAEFYKITGTNKNTFNN